MVVGRHVRSRSKLHKVDTPEGRSDRSAACEAAIGPSASDCASVMFALPQGLESKGGAIRPCRFAVVWVRLFRVSDQQRARLRVTLRAHCEAVSQMADSDLLARAL